MKYNFPVVIRKKQNNLAVGDELVFQHLRTRWVLSAVDLETINEKGLNKFVEETMLDIVKYRLANKKSIETPGLNSTYIQSSLKRGFNPMEGPHDQKLNVTVELNRPYGFFTAVLPPATTVTILVEAAANTILAIGALELSQTKFFSPSIAEALDIAQAIGYSSLALFQQMVGLAFVEDFGAILDDKIRHLCCTPEDAQDLPAQAKEDERLNYVAHQTPSNAILASLCKGIFFALSINYMVSDITQDYQEAMAWNEKIAASKNTIIPVWLNYWAKMVAFGVNQFSDPITFLTLVVLGIQLIDVFFSHEAIPVAENTVDAKSEKKDEDQKQATDSEKQKDTNAASAATSLSTAITITGNKSYGSTTDNNSINAAANVSVKPIVKQSSSWCSWLRSWCGQRPAAKAGVDSGLAHSGSVAP